MTSLTSKIYSRGKTPPSAPASSSATSKPRLSRFLRLEIIVTFDLSASPTHTASPSQPSASEPAPSNPAKRQETTVEKKEEEEEKGWEDANEGWDNDEENWGNMEVRYLW